MKKCIVASKRTRFIRRKGKIVILLCPCTSLQYNRCNQIQTSLQAQSITFPSSKRIPKKIVLFPNFSNKVIKDAIPTNLYPCQHTYEYWCNVCACGCAFCLFWGGAEREREMHWVRYHAECITKQTRKKPFPRSK